MLCMKIFCEHKRRKNTGWTSFSHCLPVRSQFLLHPQTFLPQKRSNKNNFRNLPFYNHSILKTTLEAPSATMVITHNRQKKDQPLLRAGYRGINPHLFRGARDPKKKKENKRKRERERKKRKK